MTKTYPAKARAASRREARRRASRPPRQFTRSADPIAEGIERNAVHQCDVKGCWRPRMNLSRYCTGHGRTYKTTGHPIALHIKRRTWRPFVRQAEAFVRSQLRQEHAGIVAGLRWVVAEIARAENPTDHNESYLRYAEALVRAHRNGVDAVAFLARVIAGELADDRGTDEPCPRYPSDVYANHQRARLFLLPHPIGLARSTWGDRRTYTPQPAIEYSRLSLSTCAYTFKRINAALGLLALKAAEAIREQQRQRQ